MMEIAFGPVIAACALKSLAFGVVFALAVTLIEARFRAGSAPSTLARRIGLGLLAGGIFGLAHLAIICAADGFPPRIVQSAALGLLLVALAGLGLSRARRQPMAPTA